MVQNPLRTLISLRGHGRDRDAIDRFRTFHLRRVVRHAYEHVPYYRRLFESVGLRPEDIRTPADLRHVPVTTRDTLQQLDGREIVARGVDPERLLAASSSGSSGRPITIRRTWIEDRLLAAIRIRVFTAFGLRRHDRVAGIRTPRVTKRRDLALASRVLAALRPDRWQVVDVALPAEEIVSRVAALGANVLNSYPGQLALVATQVDAARLQALGLRFLTAGGEVLFSSQRQSIAEAFGAPVYETYASTEFDVLAAQCPQSGSDPAGIVYHAMDDSLILELRDERDGAVSGEHNGAVGGERNGVVSAERDGATTGEVVGTCLHAYAMPLIRYVQGDIVERGGPCDCGSAFSTLRTIQGRTLDFFVLPDDRWIHPYEVFVPIRERCQWIQRFQAIQRSPLEIVLRIEAGRAPSSSELETVRATFAERFSDRAELEVELVERFDTGPGKFRQYRSLVRTQPARPGSRVDR